MRNILAKAALVSFVCVVLKWGVFIVLAPILGGRLDPVNIFIFLISPVLIAMPVAGFIFWQDDKLRGALRSLEQAHRQLGEAHSALGEKAMRDDMTGLLNRDAFHSAFVDDTGAPLDGALLIVDVDRFKQINDNFGHLAGDRALLDISAAISNALRQDDLAGRIGGEEFAAFLKGATLEEAEQVAERIRRRVANLRFVPEPGVTVPLTVSVGGAIAQPGISLPDLLEFADRRLYEAKNTGRNRIVMPKRADLLARAG